MFGWDVDMLVSDDKPATIQTAENYRQYSQQLARKGVIKKYDVSMAIPYEQDF